MAIGTKWQQQTTSYNQSFEGTLQIARDFNQNLDVLAQRIETLRKEEARRYEIMMEEEARRHEQLLELIRSRFVHAREEEITVQVPKEEKKLNTHTHSSREKRVNNQALLSLVDDRSLHSLIDFGAAKATKVGSTTFAPLIVKAGPEKLGNSYYPQFAKKEQGHQPLADSRKSRLKGSDTALGIDEMQEYKQVPFDPGPNEGTTHSIEGVTIPNVEEGVSHIPIITSELPMVIKHRAQVIVVRPYWIKPETTMEKTHACIQKPHREITDSTQKKEIVAILLGVNSQFHANSFPRMDFLMFSGITFEIGLGAMSNASSYTKSVINKRWICNNVEAAREITRLAESNAKSNY
uniref:Uncharacterized protein n=1 Tax=Ananas comosus var. bracteatus TaxID=296719 RepID=A0A6V7QRZ0_ANACO